MRINETEDECGEKCVSVTVHMTREEAESLRQQMILCWHAYTLPPGNPMPEDPKFVYGRLYKELSRVLEKLDE